MPEWLTPLGVVIPLGVALMSGSGLLALVAWRKQHKAEPIEASAAAIANAEKASGMALALAQRLDSEVQGLRVEIAAVRTRAHYADAWIADLHTRWAEHRIRDSPPPYVPPSQGGPASGS